ncbi:hypothetical protein F5Y15DRAFT_237281 [Xylariaceae sp. FL0016]|nr:hypothetical protein F5Y15DRAFT_237281 [Xylariaceae sp. FL0016]
MLLAAASFCKCLRKCRGLKKETCGLFLQLFVPMLSVSTFAISSPMPRWFQFIVFGLCKTIFIIAMTQFDVDEP